MAEKSPVARSRHLATPKETPLSVLNGIACLQNRRDNVTNQPQARELVNTGNADGIREVANNLSNNDRNIQSDCIKVPYEVGCISPQLIARCVDDFLKPLTSRNNRTVWGAMLALSTIADIQAARACEFHRFGPAHHRRQ